MRRHCIVARRLWEEPLCCGLHPSGLLALVGTAEKLHVYHVTRVRGLSFITSPGVGGC